LGGARFVSFGCAYDKLNQTTRAARSRRHVRIAESDFGVFLSPVGNVEAKTKVRLTVSDCYDLSF
jgi:hypothetical protein